jgi:DNA polymerase III subunit epsilon
MVWFVIAVIVTAVFFFFIKRKKMSNLSVLPKRFVVFDFETTGLNPELHEIIEIGATRVTPALDNYDTFQILIRPSKKISKKTTELTGITQEMVEKDGDSLKSALPQFLEFIGDLPLVSFNAEFDMAFLKNAIKRTQINAQIKNHVSCALKMARRAWPGRKSYRLSDLAKDGNLSGDGNHRALDDCKRAMFIYIAAASKLGSAT